MARPSPATNCNAAAIAAELRDTQRPGRPAPADLVERRAGLNAAVAAGYWRTDPAPVEVVLNGVRCLRFAAPGDARGTVMHMHGGAFRIGCPEQMGPFAAALAARCMVDVVCPAYRLAPEHPYPAGLGDGLTVLAELAANSAAPLVLSGDLAGGGLAASLAALAHRSGYGVGGLVLLSAWLDLTVSDAAYQSNATTDPLFSAAAAHEAAALYLQGNAPQDSLVSPLLGDLAGFPPTYLNVGTGEVLAGDADRLAERLRSAGVPISFHAIEGMEHVAVTRGNTLTGSVETFARLSAFLDGVLAQH